MSTDYGSPPLNEGEDEPTEPPARPAYYRRHADSLIAINPSNGKIVVFPRMGETDVLSDGLAYAWMAANRPLIKAKYILTRTCNLRCYHCFASDDYTTKGVATSAALNIVGQIADAGVLFLQFCGGEVAERADLPDLINYASGRGLVVDFFSNGTQFSDDFFQRTNFSNVYAITITLHSDRPSINDALTGVPGSLHAALCNIKRLRKHTDNVILKVVLTPKTVESVIGLYELSKQLGVRFGFDANLFPSNCSPLT